jgi:hypothetical protein
VYREIAREEFKGSSQNFPRRRQKLKVDEEVKFSDA